MSDYGKKDFCPRCKTWGEVIVGQFLNCACGKNTAAPEAAPTVYYKIAITAGSILSQGVSYEVFASLERASTEAAAWLLANPPLKVLYIFAIPSELFEDAPIMGMFGELVGRMKTTLDLKQTQATKVIHSPITTVSSIPPGGVYPTIVPPGGIYPTSAPPVPAVSTLLYYYCTTSRNQVLRAGQSYGIYAALADAESDVRQFGRAGTHWYIFPFSPTLFQAFPRPLPTGSSANGVLAVDVDCGTLAFVRDIILPGAAPPPTTTAPSPAPVPVPTPAVPTPQLMSLASFYFSTSLRKQFFSAGSVLYLQDSLATSLQLVPSSRYIFRLSATLFSHVSRLSNMCAGTLAADLATDLIIPCYISSGPAAAASPPLSGHPVPPPSAP